MAGGLPQHQWQNWFRAAALLAGRDDAPAALIAGAFCVVKNTSVSPKRFLRVVGARRLNPGAAPSLHAAVTELWQCARLTEKCRLYPNAELLQALTAGTRPHNEAIVAAVDIN
jgi:hypothetical protein